MPFAPSPRVAVAVLSLSVLGGCGNRGDLYLIPDEDIVEDVGRLVGGRDDAADDPAGAAREDGEPGTPDEDDPPRARRGAGGAR